MRIVLDTNIWISGLLLPQSMAGEILTAWKKGNFHVVTSRPILDEIKKVLAYPKIQKRTQWDAVKIEQYVSLLLFSTDCVAIPAITSTELRDPDDLPILATLLAGNAECLVTGDDDLLSLKSQYPIQSLSDFHKKIF